MGPCLYVFSVWSLLSTFCHVVPTQSALRASGNVVQQLRLLIDEESSLRGNLESKVNALRTEASKINNTLACVVIQGTYGTFQKVEILTNNGGSDAVAVPCNCPTSIPKKPKGPQIAYTGTLPKYTSSLTTSTELKYSNDLINVGTPFNVTSGHFRANVSGLYAFAMSLYMSPAYWTSMQLVKNGSPFLYARTGHYKSGSTNRQVNMATNFALVSLKAGDEVWPKYVSGSSSNLYADGVTTFTGVLLRET